VPAAQVAVHGHFYQPPRENPWTGEIDRQPSAAPFHDWNERIHAECYRPNALATLQTEGGERVVNNFERLSFNVGPTLLSWIERFHPATYARILDADQRSIERLGRGNAIAQSFHHTILPLSPERDVRTQVRWGLTDFRHRFGRDSEGMWLPETAANDDVLKVLIEEGVRFTILAPHQAERWRDPGGGWQSVAEAGIDTRLPHRYEHPDGSGRWLALFFYDGGVAHAVAFDNVMASAEGFLDLLLAGADTDSVTPQLIHAATDGESFGHHHKFGEIGLAYALFVEAERRGVEPTNYAAFLAQSPPTREVKIVPGEGTSWSCAHGVERWRTDCGCHTGGRKEWNQQWRGPLRDALDILRAAADDAFERLGTAVLDDPWEARDRYAGVVVGARSLESFLSAEARDPSSALEAGRAGTLLEMQEEAMAMFTSCGWFFSDIGGIETIQVLRYAARVLEILEALGEPSPRDAFVAKLAEAKSNDPETGTGADVFGEALAARP
jgi:alpha-amylase/alpha-mannosidase (GH57 family)